MDIGDDPVMRRRSLIAFLSVALLVLDMAVAARTADGPPAERVVFIGDSITDGHTCPLLFEQSLREAKKPVPVCLNAGVAGDTAAGVRRRLDRDVLSHQPTLAVLMIGTND